MTNLRALQLTLRFPLPDEMLEKALEDAGFDPANNYVSKDNLRGIDLCAAGLLYVLFLEPDIKEGDYAKTMPSAEKLRAAYSILVNKWGVPDLLAEATPTISSVSPW